MSDEQKALVARLRSFVERHGHNDMAVTTLDTDDARAILAHVEAQASDIAALREALQNIGNLAHGGKIEVNTMLGAWIGTPDAYAREVMGMPWRVDVALGEQQ